MVVAVAADAAAKSFKAAVAQGFAALKGGGAKSLAVAWGGSGTMSDAHAEAAVLALADATYVYRHTKPSAPAAWAADSLTLICQKAEAKGVQAGLTRGAAIAEGVTLAREFGNRPGNECTPTWLGQQAKKIGKAFDLEVEVLDRKQIEKLGMGAFLAVSQASAEPPRFIVARYQGAAKGEAPVVLVGKGITFDTGGISIKPAAEMDEMKFDMCGAASVLGTLHAVAKLKARLNLVCIVPTCENMPGGKAIKPGDVVTSMSGQTVEILNTDAEGRLILCDALTYAERLKPAVVVDVATLTGACVIALGHHNSGLFSSDDGVADKLLAASRAAARPVLADAARRRVRRGAEEQLRRHGQRRRPAGRRDHRRDVPEPVHRQVPLGASRHRRHRLEVGHGQGRDRPAGRAADPFRPRPRQIGTACAARRLVP